LVVSTSLCPSEEPEDLVFAGEFEIRGREQGVKAWSVTSSMGEKTSVSQTFQSIAKEPKAPAGDVAGTGSAPKT